MYTRAVTKPTRIKMSHFKLLALMVVLQSAYCQSGQMAKSTDEGHGKAPVDLIGIQEILAKNEEEMNKMKQRMDDQKSEHEKQIYELRHIVAKQDGRIKEQNGKLKAQDGQIRRQNEQMKKLMKFMADTKATILEQETKGQQKTSDIKSVNETIAELEQRVDDQEIAMLDVREDVFDIGADVVRVSADVLVAEENIDTLEANDEAQDQQISVLETTVNDYLDVAIGFHVTLNSAKQTLAKGDAVLFDTIVTNYGEAFDLTSGSFVAPRHGLYWFSSYMLTSDSALPTDLCIMVNGACVCAESAGTDLINDRAYDTGTCSALVELQPGDIVNVVFYWDYQSDGGEVHHNRHTGFSGWLYKAL